MGAIIRHMVYIIHARVHVLTVHSYFSPAPIEKSGIEILNIFLPTSGPIPVTGRCVADVILEIHWKFFMLGE